jgi:hypothetical protein
MEYPKNTQLNTNHEEVASGPVERYANTDEMRAEFGDYRVNRDTCNLSDSALKQETSNNMDGLLLTNDDDEEAEAGSEY